MRLYPNLEKGSKIKIHRHGNIFIPGVITDRRGNFIVYKSDDSNEFGGVNLSDSNLSRKIQFDELKESKLLRMINQIITEELKKVQLKENSSQQQIEDLAVDLIDYLGKQLPSQGYLQNKRIMNFFQDAGINDISLIKKIYNRALQLNRE